MKKSTYILPDRYSFKTIWRITFPILATLVCCLGVFPACTKGNGDASDDAGKCLINE